MALTAKFTADFSQFESAIQSASVTVNTFEKGVKSAAADLNRMAASLSGAEIQRQAATAAKAIEAIGGASKLTAAEATKMLGPIDQALDKYKALGQQAPAELEKLQKELGDVRRAAEEADKATDKIGGGLQAGADKAGGAIGSIKGALSGLGPAIAASLTVDKVIGFAQSIVALGGEIEDMAERTGFGIEAVQEFKYAAEQTGSSLDKFAGAASKLNDALATGENSTARSLDAIGLSLEHIRAMRPEDAFTLVAEAVGRIPDPMEQTRVAMDLFGKAGAEMLPAMKAGFGELREEAHKFGQVLAEEDVKTLAAFGDAWDGMLHRLKVGTATAFFDIKAAFSDLGTFANGVFLSMKTGSVGGFLIVGEAARHAAKAADIEWDKYEQDQKARAARINAALGLAKGPPVLSPAEEKALKDAQAAAKAFADELQKLRDQISGAALQGEIKKLDAAWKGLTDTQRASTQTIKNVVALLGGYVAAGGKLTPELQKIWEEHKRVLTAVTDLTGGFSKALPILDQYTDKLKAPTDALKGLRLDGLLPISRSFADVATTIDTAGIQTNNLAGQFRNAADAAHGLKEQADKLAAVDFGRAFGDAIVSGFRAEGLAGALRNVGTLAADTITTSIQTGIEAKVKSGEISLAGAFGSTVGAVAIGAIANVWTEMFIEAITQTKQKAKEQSRIAGEAIASQFAEGFGGTKAMRAFAEAAGATDAQIARVMTGTVEQVQEGIAALTPAINRYKQTLEGLATAAGGVNLYAQGLADQFAPAVAEQKRALEESHAAILQYEKDAGASAEQLAGLQTKLAADLKGQVFAATAENIDRINALGTITAGVLANTVGRTGDLVSAIKAVGPALENIAKMRDQFGLAGEQLSPVTAEVLKLYETVRANEDVFSIISGLGQAMAGLGQAFIYTSDLASAFGGELAAQFTILTDRGVEANLALATMAPQLQELWEVAESGRITVDETTQALLNQAEAQGIVGDHMRDANEQILEVLVEIKDLFAVYLPTAIARTGDAIVATSARGGNAIARTQAQAQQLARDLGPGVQNATNQANAALDTLARRRITIPIDWDVSELPSEMGGAPPEFGGGGTTQVNVNLDGRTIAEVTAPHMGGVVNAYGVS